MLYYSGKRRHVIIVELNGDITVKNLFIVFMCRFIQVWGREESALLEGLYRTLCSLFDLSAPAGGHDTVITADFLKNESLGISRILGPGAVQKIQLTFDKIETFSQIHNFPK